MARLSDGEDSIPNHGYYFAHSRVYDHAVWLGEQILQKGIGNGISLLHYRRIIAGLPAAVIATYKLFYRTVGARVATRTSPGVLMLALLSSVTAGLVAITQAQRKIPVQYTKTWVGRKVYGGQSSRFCSRSITPALCPSFLRVRF